MAMHRICAWCNTGLDASTVKPEGEITHGICGRCLEYFCDKTEDVEPLERFLDRIEAPILVADPDGIILTANRLAMDLVQKDRLHVRGLPGGEVMECAYARLPGGCGRTDHCDGCTIRNTVMATHADGVSRREVVARQDLLGPEGVLPMRILISTEKVGATVLLRIDSITSEPGEAD